MTQNFSVDLIVRSTTHTDYGENIPSKPAYQIPDYCGYIPHIGDWIKFPTSVGTACLKVVSRDLEFKDSKLLSVVLWT